MKRLIFPLLTFLALLTGCGSSDKEAEVPVDNSLLKISTGAISISSNEAIKEITVESSEGWTTEISEETKKWLSVSPSSSADGGTVTVSVIIKENTAYDDREGTVIFSLDNGKNQTLTVTQEHIKVLNVEEDAMFVDKEGGTISIPISYNVDEYKVDIVCGSGESTAWIRQQDTRSLTDETLVFSVDPNDLGLRRKATITISAKSGKLTHEVIVTQSGAGVEDGEYFRLQKATVGTGVNLILMGDGYTEEEVNGSGKYQTEIEEAMEDFFSVYPYNAFREYFNVWMVVGISNESGVTTGSNKKDTRFSANITGNGTEISCSYNTVTSYAKSIPGLPGEDELTVILILNSPLYAGTCMMTGTGYSISMCPRIVSDVPTGNARAVIIHEAGGHGFAKLCDEYRYYKQTIPVATAENIKGWQYYFRAQMNIDFTGDLSKILWKDFLKYDKYTTSSFSPVGAYEGNSYYYYGAWRPEENSCMNDNVDYYNAPSRWEIVRRIMDLSGESSKYASETAMFEWFVENDDAPQPTYSRSQADMSDFVPFAPPVMMN